MGDKIQGLESKYICSYKYLYDINDSDIYVKKRVLATLDRPLMSYAMVENDINFLSMTTFNSIKTVFWNFGEAFKIFSGNEHLGENLQYNMLPSTSFFSSHKVLDFNNFNKINLEHNNIFSNLNNNNTTKKQYKLYIEFMKKLNEIKDELKIKKNIIERERLELERLEKERLELERLELERLELERIEKERLEKSKAEIQFKTPTKKSPLKSKPQSISPQKIKTSLIGPNQRRITNFFSKN